LLVADWPLWSGSAGASCCCHGVPAADSAVAVVTSEFQKFSPFVSEEEGAEPLVQGGGPQSLEGAGLRFSIGRILEDEGGADCGFYCEGGAVGLHPPLRPEAEQRHVRRSMRDRHLRLLGYTLLQLPYQELEKLSGIEDVKQYLHQKLLDL
ncbi:hypothetical protein F7725_010752, partial [Dissostichus mawsoni]